MRRALLHVFPVMALVGALVAPSLAVAEPDLLGTYLARGVNPDGSEYQLIVQIAQFGESYLVMTMLPGALSEVSQPMLAGIGIGVLNGGVLAVADFSPDTGRVVSYRVEDGGRRLMGRWAYVDGDGTVREETLTKLPRRLEIRGDAGR